MKKISFLALLVVPLVFGLVVSAAAQPASEPFTYCADEPEYCQTKIAQVPIPWQFWAIKTDTTGVTTVTDRIRISPTWLEPPEGQPAGEGSVLVSRQFATAPTVIPLEELVWDPENGPIPTRTDLQWQLPLDEQRLKDQGMDPFIEVRANEDDLELDILVTAGDAAVLVVYEVKLDANGPVVGHFINEAELGIGDDGNPTIVQVFVNFDVHNGTGVNVTNFELDFLGLGFTCDDVVWALGYVKDTLDLWGANEENPLVVHPIEGGTEVKWIQPERPLEPSETLHVGLSFELGDLIDGAVDVAGTAVNVTVQGYWTVLCGEGRMTGGGSVLSKDYGRVTHGFELHCDVSESPNNLQVNWGKGNKFHLTELTWAACLDRPAIDERPPVAGFDTYAGFGKGRYNGEPGATIAFGFTDEGEPGKNDRAVIRIFDADNNPVLMVAGNLKNGNHQAHGN